MSDQAKPQHYKDLIIWQKGIELTKAEYRMTEGLPESEKYGLVNQMRRAAVSVPSNIAEGQARRRGTGSASSSHFSRMPADRWQNLRHRRF
jgi:four helix bundle protein